MASSKKPRSADPAGTVGRFLDSLDLRGKRVGVALSGGVDSVALLHVLDSLKSNGKYSLRAVHVHHGLSPSADEWASFCRKLCRQWRVPLTIRRVKITKAGKGLEAAAREARYAAFRKISCDVLVLGHHLDDQAETVLMNLLRGAGLRGASGMPAHSRLGDRALLRPFLAVSRETIVAYARAHGLGWIEDESNADESLTRNFVRRRVGPLLESRFPRWRENLARAAGHFADADLDARALLREFLAQRGLRAPSEAKLVEMLKQLTSRGARTLVEHDGMRLRVYRGKLSIEAASGIADFAPLAWNGERRLPIPALGGELRLSAALGQGIDAELLSGKSCVIRLRSGGERLQPDARRPRRALKNLFQEAGVPPWERDRMPLLFCGDDLVWVPGLGIDVRYQTGAGAAGVLPEWRREANRAKEKYRSKPLFLRKTNAAHAKIQS
jgi:tRNA(Ile)-lysidine synthase